MVSCRRLGVNVIVVGTVWSSLTLLGNLTGATLATVMARRTKLTVIKVRQLLLIIMATVLQW